MSTRSEENAANPLHALDTLVVGRSRRPSEWPEMGPAAVGGGNVRGSRPDSLRSMIAAGDPLDSATSEFVRRRIKPEDVSAPPYLTRGSAGRMGLSSAMGIAAAVAVACFVALLFVTLFPGERDALQSFAAAAPPAREASGISKREPAREIDAANADGTSLEQPESLLRQFVQWRQKVAVTEKQ